MDIYYVLTRIFKFKNIKLNSCFIYFAFEKNLFDLLILNCWSLLYLYYTYHFILFENHILKG